MEGHDIYIYILYMSGGRAVSGIDHRGGINSAIQFRLTIG